MEEECDKKQCKLMLEPIVMEEVDDTEGSEEESNCNRLRDGTRLCEPLSAVFKPKGSWRSGEKVTHASGVWNDTEETNFLRQWCKSTPVPRILLEVLNGSGSGRHNNRGTKADRPLDWVIILCVYLIIFLFIYFTLHGENYRWHCTTSCGTCSIDGTPDDICMQHNGSGHYTFPSISTTSWHYDFIVAAVLNGMGNCTTGHANLTSSVNVPVRGLVEYSTQPVCNQDERCAVLLFGQGIGRHYGDFQTNVTASLPESCPWVSVDVIVFTGSETWHIIEATLRMILLIVSVYIVHFTSKRLRARIASKQPHLGIQRLLLGVMPFVFLTLNPFFIFAVYFHDDGTDAARFFYFMENVPPKLLIAAYSTFLLTMVSNTSRICPFPVVFNIAVDHVVPAGISETNSPVVITAEIHRECPVVMTIQNGWRAFDAMLGMNSKTCVDTLAPEEIIQMIEDSPSLWSILKIQQLTNWGAVVRSMKQEVAEPDEIPLSMMAGQQDDVEYRGITRSEFARVWSSAVNEQQSVLCPATEWLAPTSKAFSTFQFDVSELIACPLARGCSFVVKVIVDIDGMKRERRIRLTKDIQALCLTRQVVVPRPVFTVTENVAGLYSCLVAAALTIVNETAKPDVMVRVTGSLPFEEPLTIKYVMSSPQDILAVFMGMALVSTAVARFSLRDWERYRMDEYYVGTKVIFDEGNRVEESIDELVFSLWFVLAFGLLTVAWLHLKQLPYRHSRHLHLLHHGIMGLILLVVAAGVLGYVLRPVRLMEIFLWRWGEMVNLTACCLSLVLCMALCPPRVVQLDADTITKETVLQYMKETGGSRLRTFRTVADKLYIDNWLKRGCNSGQKVSTVPFGEENEDKNSAEHSKDEESVEIEPLDLHGFCLETAVSSFYASSVVYEPVLRPTVILRQHSTFSGLFEEDVVNIRKDMPRWSQLCINYPVDIFLKGRAWPSVAHYMHTMCSLSHSGIIARMVSVSETPYIAKDTASRHMDFERTANMTQQLGFMTEAIGEKFRQSSECRKILLDTGSRHIRFIDEDDPYWGCDMDGRGGNMIGSILMDVRRELNETYPLDDVLVEMRAKVQGKHTDSTDHLLALLRMQFDNYENTEARETLLSTMDKTLVNLTDRDVFWGVGENGLGENQYCILLMKLREEYRRAFEEAVPDTLKVTRNFDWIFKMFKVDAIISSEITKPSAKPAEPGHEAEPEDDMELNDMESGETKCVILSTHADYQTTFVLVSFRGTITFQNGDFDWRNVMTDCRCTQSEIQVGDETVMVHAGFADLWGRFRERVIATLVDKLSLEDEDDDTTLVFTGHSLGGALATLAAMDVAANVYKKRRITMYNFGSPRVGDKHFAELYDKLVPDSFRVVCKGDPVPMLPPMFFYTHVGHSVLMNSAGEFVVDAGFAERRILPYFNPYQHVRLLDSHRRGDTPGGEPGYLQGITNIANKFNLRSREELSHKMNMGQKYSPEWRRLWSVCSQGNPMDYEVVFLHEAMQFCGEPPPVPQRVPLNVYHSELRNDSMVAATAEQQAWAVAHGFRYMKTLGDVFTFPRGDGRSWFKGELKPLYLCYNESRNDHMSCSSNAMKKFAKQHGYKKLSIEGFVFPDAYRPLEQHMSTVGLEITWSPHELNHSVQVEGTKTMCRNSLGQWIEKLELEHNSDCYIAQTTGPGVLAKIWTGSGLLPLSLLSGLLTIVCGEHELAPKIASFVSFGILVYGYLLSRGAVITRYPRLLDIFTSVTFGTMWGIYDLGDFSSSKKEVWAVPLLLTAQLLAVSATVFVKSPYTVDIWLEDRSIPPGTAHQLGFRFFVRIYAYINMSELFLLILFGSIPGMVDPDGSDTDTLWYAALGVLISVNLLLLFQHAIVFWLLSLSAMTCSTVSPCEKLMWNVDEFCELFPAPPSLVVGRFIIREATEDRVRQAYTPLWIASSHLHSDETPPFPGNHAAYVQEVAALLNHPISRTNVVVTPAEGSDGTWGAEVRFNLVLPSLEAAQETMTQVKARLTECTKTPALYFGHTMRTVRVREGWWVSNAGVLNKSGLFDFTLRHGPARPPLSQPGKALEFARLMAQCLRQKMVIVEDRMITGNEQSPTPSSDISLSESRVIVASPLRRRLAKRRQSSSLQSKSQSTLSHKQSRPLP